MSLKNKKPLKVSIITVVHNAVDTIRQAIQSVAYQTYEDIEYIIIDNNSSDGTLEVIHNKLEYISIVISEKDNGIYHAINKGIKASSGDIIGFLNSDDVLKNRQTISDIASEFLKYDIDSIYGDLEYFSFNYSNRIERYWKSGDFNRKKMKFGWMPPHPTFYVKRSIYQKYGNYDTTYSISSDYEMLLKLLYKNKISVRYIPNVLVKMRSGGVSNSNIKSILLKTTEDYRIIKKYNFSMLTLVLKNIRKIPQLYSKK